MILNFDISSPEEQRYLEANARARNTVTSVLLNRILHVILRDKLILGVLDDSDECQPVSGAVPSTRSQYKARGRRYMKKGERELKFAEMIRERSDRRICRADLGDFEEQCRWSKPINTLLANGTIRKLPPQRGSRHVYFVLTKDDTALAPAEQVELNTEAVNQ